MLRPPCGSLISSRRLQPVGNHIHRTLDILIFHTAYILQKVPPGKWLGMNVILWGIVTACTASVKSYHGLLASRILLGIFEAALAPCLMLIIGEDLSAYHILLLIICSIMYRNVVHET